MTIKRDFKKRLMATLKLRYRIFIGHQLLFVLEKNSIPMLRHYLLKKKRTLSIQKIFAKQTKRIRNRSAFRWSHYTNDLLLLRHYPNVNRVLRYSKYASIFKMTNWSCQVRMERYGYSYV